MRRKRCIAPTSHPDDQLGRPAERPGVFIMPDIGKIATLHSATRVWAVGAVHGDHERLAALHDMLAPRVMRGDRLVYLGNDLGVGKTVRETVDELLRFRRIFLATGPYTDPGDVVFLRGAQEEMWHKLLQLQFASNPADVLRWALDRGVDSTLRAYGGDPADGFSCAESGPLALTRWTTRIRDRFRAEPGHETLMSALKRAAVTADGQLLFVSTGVDVERPLLEQTDSFWWAGRCFTAIDGHYNGFRKIVRGYDPEHFGIKETPYIVCLDGGCGFGGRLIAGCLAPDGRVLETIDI